MKLPLHPEDEADLLFMLLSGDPEFEWIAERLLDLHYQAVGGLDEEE